MFVNTLKYVNAKGCIMDGITHQKKYRHGAHLSRRINNFINKESEMENPWKIIETTIKRPGIDLSNVHYAENVITQDGVEMGPESDIVRH